MRRLQGLRGFTLVELLVVIGITSALSALLVAAVGGSRQMARDVTCRSNLRQLGIAVGLYENGNGGYFPPLGYWKEYPARYWWGVNSAPPRYADGFLASYIGKAGKDGDVYQCPEQPPGSYTPEGEGGALTTTYGYNGYYLCPEATPGWASSIKQRPWQNIGSQNNPGQVLMFADTLLDWGKGRVTNSCFIDPPFVYSKGKWSANLHPTLCFRHRGQANVCFVDGHVESISSSDGTIVSAEQKTGYVGSGNAPHYVPDCDQW